MSRPSIINPKIVVSKSQIREFNNLVHWLDKTSEIYNSCHWTLLDVKVLLMKVLSNSVLKLTKTWKAYNTSIYTFMGKSLERIFI